MRPNQLAAAAGVIVLAAGLAGCGGGGEESVSSGPTQPGTTTSTERSSTTGSGESAAPSHPATPSIEVSGDPEKGIRGAITAVLAPHPPGPASAQTACGLFVTDRYLQTTYGTRQGCIRALVPGSAADSVKISSVAVHGDGATAHAVPRGGPSSGERITVKLVRGGSVWKVDSLRSNAPVGP